MCCIMGYAGHDLPKETFTEYLLRTTSRGPDDQRVAETEFGLLVGTPILTGHRAGGTGCDMGRAARQAACPPAIMLPGIVS